MNTSATRRDRGRRERAEVDEVRAREEEHRERGEREHGRGAEVGLQQDEDHDRHVITRNGTVPRQNPRTAVPRLANQWARYTTSASFMNSAGWTAGSGPILSQRAEPPTTMLISGTNTSIRLDDADREQRDRGDPQPAVVDPHHHDHRDHPERRPLDLRADDRERVVALEERLHRGRRVDHQDADRGEGDDRDEDPVLGLVALALERVVRLRPRSPAGRRRRRAVSGVVLIGAASPRAAPTGAR